MSEPAAAGKPEGEARDASEPRTSRLRREARRAWKRLRGGELSPRRAALSVAVGLLIGLTPLYGTHIFLVLLVCVPLRLDAPLAYLAANVSLPFVSPFILFAEVELGALVRGGHSLDLDVATLKARGVGPFLADLVVGTALVAPGAAILGGALTFGLATRWARRKEAQGADPFDAAARAVALRYAPGRRAAYHYVRGKLAGDPVARALVELGRTEALGEVLDVGAGRGQMTLLLLEAGVATRVHGLDWDAVKVADANRAASGLDARFDVGDARDLEAGAADTVLLVDVLHYLEPGAQDALLDRVASAARRRVVVRDLDPDRGWRSTVTRIEEWIATRTRVNRGGLHVRAIAATTSRLEARGFRCRVEPCWRGTPFANVLVVATRETDGDRDRRADAAT